MRTFKITPFAVRMVTASLMAGLGLAMVFTIVKATSFAHKHAEDVQNIYATGSSPSGDNGGDEGDEAEAIIAQVRYLATGANSRSSTALFVAGLVCWACGGGYLLMTLKSAVSRLLASSPNSGGSGDEIAQRLELLAQHLSTKEIVRKWWKELLHGSDDDPADRFFAAFFAVVGVLVAGMVGVMVNIDDWGSSTVRVRDLQVLREELGSGGESDAVPVLGGSEAYGDFTVEKWTCQVQGLFVGGEGYESVKSACAGGVSLFLLLSPLPLSLFLCPLIV